MVWIRHQNRSEKKYFRSSVAGMPPEGLDVFFLESLDRKLSEKFWFEYVSSNISWSPNFLKVPSESQNFPNSPWMDYWTPQSRQRGVREVAREADFGTQLELSRRPLGVVRSYFAVS